MMLGLATGDSVGNTSQGMTPADRSARFGEIRDYLPHPRFRYRRGYPSDGTPLAFWTLEDLSADGRFVPEHVLDVFARREIFGIGSAVCRALLAQR